MHLVTRFLLTNEEPDMLKCMYLAMDKRLVIPTVCALQPTFGTLRVAICWHWRLTHNVLVQDYLQVAVLQTSSKAISTNRVLGVNETMNIYLFIIFISLLLYCIGVTGFNHTIYHVVSVSQYWKMSHLNLVLLVQFSCLSWLVPTCFITLLSGCWLACGFLSQLALVQRMGFLLFYILQSYFKKDFN